MNRPESGANGTLTDDEWHELQRLHRDEGVAKRELARRFGRDVKTIRRALERSEPPSVAPAARRKRRLDPFRAQIVAWLRADPDLTARRIAVLLGPRLGKVSDRTVRKYVEECRTEVASAPVGDVEGSDTGDVATGEADASPARAGALVRTPPNPDPLPRFDSSGDYRLGASECYLNREITWLNFNWRVLHEATDRSVPLLERLKFVAIVSSNLDEFFMKRIGGLKQQALAGVQERTVDGRTPQEQIAECCEIVRALELRKREIFLEVKDELEKNGIELAVWSELTDGDRAALREEYVQNIYPLVTPQASDPAHPFPFISNLSLNLLVVLRYARDPVTSHARVKIPVGAGTPRFLRLPNRDAYVQLESVIAHNLDLLFPGMVIDSHALFRVTRNANTELDEDKADDLLAMIETGLRERRFAPIVRLEVAAGMASSWRGMLAAELGLNEENDVFEVEGILGMRDLMELASLPHKRLRTPTHHPVDHPALTTDRNVFHVLRDAGSILVHTPYQSYATSVERFLREASTDPKVRAIKMTLYRTSSDSKVIEYLIDAARNGKQVAVVVELKARFDEAANIRWANRLEETGVHVTYGVVGLKTHCKVILVLRHDYDGLRRYAHIGTGNYHAGTARLYSDVGLLTSDPTIGADLTELLNYLTTGFKPKRPYRKLLVAPKLLKDALLERIDREILLHSDESPGRIQIKTNALEDPDVTRALYRASRAGVRVDLFVRDTCRLRPGIPRLSSNVTVLSIVGPFLEHARIYHFRNGGNEEYYLGSADCMLRNLESRVEFLCPVESPELREELRTFLDAQLRERRGAWEMLPDGGYALREPAGSSDEHSQRFMVDWAERRLRNATRLRKRKTRGIERRNVR